MLFQNFYENRKGHVGKLYYSFKTVEPIDLEKFLKSLPESVIQIRRDGREWMLTNRHDEKFIIEYNHSYDHSYYIIFIKSGYSILKQLILWFQNHYFKLIFSCVNINQLCIYFDLLILQYFYLLRSSICISENVSFIIKPK